MSTETVKDMKTADFDRVVNRLLERLMELEAKKGDSAGEASRGWQSNQLDARGNRGGIWYVVDSKWSMVALILAALAIGISITSGTYLAADVIESKRQLAREERLKINAVDDLRMEFRAVLRAAGVESEAPENTDISHLAEKATKGTKP